MGTRAYESRARNIPFARFLASCSGVKFATPLEPGADFRFLGSGPLVEAGVVDSCDPSSFGSPVLTSIAGRSLFMSERGPPLGGAGDAAAVI